MVQATSTALTFDDFIALYPENGGRYELRYGEMVEMRPIGPHEEVIALIRRKLDLEIEKYNLPYFIPQTCLVKPYKEAEGYLPDIIVLDKEKVKEDPYWKKASSVSTGSAIRLIVEVVSTNWQDDYLTKLAEYEKLGVAEYWISDYRGLGGIRFIGSPKVPTVWIYELSKQGDTSEFREGKAFREEDTLISSNFPHLSLSVQQIIEAGQGH
ncbi:MAG: Uma2 family endonuclease [Cyanobacteria bacterium J06649_4]